MASAILNRAKAIFFIRRDFGTINVKNPLGDKAFIRTLIGCFVAGILLLVIVTLLLCFYRENHPFDKCKGRRRRKAVEDEEKDTLEMTSDPSTESLTSKVFSTSERPKPIAPVVKKELVSFCSLPTNQYESSHSYSSYLADLSGLASTESNNTKTKDSSPSILLDPDTHGFHLQSTTDTMESSTVDTEKKKVVCGYDENFTSRYDWLMEIIHDHVEGLTGLWRDLDDHAT